SPRRSDIGRETCGSTPTCRDEAISRAVERVSGAVVSGLTRIADVTKSELVCWSEMAQSAVSIHCRADEVLAQSLTQILNQRCRSRGHQVVLLVRIGHDVVQLFRRSEVARDVFVERRFDT